MVWNFLRAMEIKQIFLEYLSSSENLLYKLNTVPATVILEVKFKILCRFISVDHLQIIGVKT